MKRCLYIALLSLIFASGTFLTASAVLPLPEITPGDTIFYTNLRVHISIPDTGSVIYTTDNSEPTRLNPAGNWAYEDKLIIIDTTTYLKARIFTVDGGGHFDSGDVKTVFYQQTIFTPLLESSRDSLWAFNNGLIDSLYLRIIGYPGSTSYYTLDGTEPTKNSIEYHIPILVIDSMIIKIFSVMEGYVDSKVGVYEFKKGKSITTGSLNINDKKKSDISELSKDSWDFVYDISGRRIGNYNGRHAKKIFISNLNVLPFSK